MKKKGFTLIELLVVIAIIAMLLAILMPALNKVKKIAQRVVCGTNLKGLGTAEAVYSNDYEGQFTRQGGAGLDQHTWGPVTNGFQAPALNWGAAKQMTVASSLYLLVREADVSPKSYVCPASSQVAYDGSNGNDLDLVELWDFGNSVIWAESGDPADHVSYSFHMPFNRFAADDSRSASFATLADKNPWFDPKITAGGGSMGAVTAENYIDMVRALGRYWDSSVTVARWEKDSANAQPHQREGQNVTFGDGHNEYSKVADVGVKHDNIYTMQLSVSPMTVDAVRRGVLDKSRYVMDRSVLEPLTSEDSILVNDDVGVVSS